MPGLSTQSHFIIDKNVQGHHGKQDQCHWVSEYINEVIQAKHANYQAKKGHYGNKHFLKSQLIPEYVQVIVWVNVVRKANCKPYVKDEKEVVALILMAGTFAQEHAVIVTFEDTFIAGETVEALNIFCLKEG